MLVVLTSFLELSTFIEGSLAFVSYTCHLTILIAFSPFAHYHTLTGTAASERFGASALTATPEGLTSINYGASHGALTRFQC